MDSIQLARMNAWIRQLMLVPDRAKQPPDNLPPVVIDPHAALNADGVEAKQVRLFGTGPRRGMRDTCRKPFLDKTMSPSPAQTRCDACCVIVPS